MKRMLCAALLVLAAGIAQAQEKPTTDKAAAAPQLPEDAKRAVTELQIKAAGLSVAMSVLQKELDATQADFSRLVQRLQAQCATVAGYELAPNMTCVVKKEPK